MLKKKILLVDDDFDSLKSNSTFLKLHGFDTEVALNSEEGYQKAKEYKPDLIVLDVCMETNIAGFDLNKKIRTDKDLNSIPIIILTGIETDAASTQVVEMYHEMSSVSGFESSKVLKVHNMDGSVAVDYKNVKGVSYLLPLDSFLSKPVDFDLLLNEVNKLLKL